MGDVAFDRDALLADLRRAALDAWIMLQALEPPEHTYGLMLYDGCAYGYVCASGFTEEGLDRVAEGAGGREGLRWSSQDSPYHALAEVGAPPLVSSEELEDDDAPWADDDGAWERYAHAVRSLCVQALQELDGEGVFAEHRDRLTLVVEDRDGTQTLDEIRRVIADLNPRAVAERYDAYLRDVCGHDI